MTVDQIELTLHHVFDHMILNDYIKGVARKVCKKYVVKKGFSSVEANNIVEHIFPYCL